MGTSLLDDVRGGQRGCETYSVGKCCESGRMRRLNSSPCLCIEEIGFCGGYFGGRSTSEEGLFWRKSFYMRDRNGD